MQSLRNGRNTHLISIGAVTPRGFWLVLGERKLFLSFAQFPWFREFTLRELTNVRRLSPAESQPRRWTTCARRSRTIWHRCASMAT
jgi:hypothetical protein